MQCVHILGKNSKRRIFMRTKTYTQMSKYETFSDRFDYLKLDGVVGNSTFGFDRHINQRFYKSTEWKQIRNYVIVRDNGCDLGVLGFDIHADILVHHINEVGVDDIIHGEEWILNPEYLITTTHNTHNAIHYGDASLLSKPFTPRAAGDTSLW